jgi:hypothetical protein
MDERAEIWIARDPETNDESRPVSLRKLRKGVRIGRLKTSMLVTRVGSTEWITLERFLADAEVATPIAPAVVIAPDIAPAIPPPGALPVFEPPPAPTPRSLTPTVPPTARADASDHDTLLTARWFAEPLPEPEDDEPIFVSHSVLDLGFERVMTTKLVKLAYVLLLATLASLVLASLVRVGGALATGDRQLIATSIATVPVVVLGCAVIGAFGRMLLEVLLAIFRISDRMTRATR